MADENFDFSPEEILAKQKAEREQAIAAAPEMAEGARAMFDAFEGKGFSPSQALYLTACILTCPDFDAP